MMRDEGYWEAVKGRVINKETKKPIEGVEVRTYDKDMVSDDYLGDTLTDKEGRFRIEFPQSAYQGKLGLTEGRPDIYLKLTDPGTGRVMTTEVHYEMEGEMEPTDNAERGGPDGEIEVMDMGDIEF